MGNRGWTSDVGDVGIAPWNRSGTSTVCRAWEHRKAGNLARDACVLLLLLLDVDQREAC